MRTSTAVILVALILLFAAYGWSAFGILVLVAAGLVLIPFVLVLGFVLYGRWRLKRTLRDFEAALRQQAAAQERRSGSIDADAEVKDLGREG